MKHTQGEDVFGFSNALRREDSWCETLQ